MFSQTRHSLSDRIGENDAFTNPPLIIGPHWGKRSFHNNTCSYILDSTQLKSASWVLYQYSCIVEECEDRELRTCDHLIRNPACFESNLRHFANGPGCLVFCVQTIIVNKYIVTIFQHLPPRWLPIVMVFSGLVCIITVYVL